MSGNAVVGSTLADFLSTLPELRALQGDIDRYKSEILAAEDEISRRKKITELLRQAAEGLTGVDLAPEKRVKLVFQIIRLLFGLLLSLQAAHQARVAAGSCLVAIDAIESEAKKRAVSTISR